MKQTNEFYTLGFGLFYGV